MYSYKDLKDRPINKAKILKLYAQNERLRNKANKERTPGK